MAQTKSKKKTSTAPQKLGTAESLLTFLNESPTAFHAVQSLRQSLEKAGFQALREEEIWKTTPGGAYYVIRAESSLVAWVMGQEPLVESGVRMVGAHTDSPHLRLKPNPQYVKCGYHQLGVEEYGGVLLSSWTDRDLSLAGRVLIKSENNHGLSSRLIKLDQPLLRVPLLAIHLNREVNEQGLVLNRQSHLPPLWGLAQEKETDPLLRLLAETLEVEPSQIISHDLSLYDLQPASFLGRNREFIASARLDNLFCCFAGLHALLEAQAVLPRSTSLLACFDHEEIGSQTNQGARSSFLKQILQRLHQSQSPSSQAEARTLARSLLLSADMAHAIHPNYADRHEPQHFPQINGGPVIKTNAQGRYATSGYSSAIFEMLCRDAGLPVQKFVNRTDLACGSTIGPMLASDLGVPTVDLGAAMLSMHSIRELAGRQDVEMLVKALAAFWMAPPAAFQLKD